MLSARLKEADEPRASYGAEGAGGPARQFAGAARTNSPVPPPSGELPGPVWFAGRGTRPPPAWEIATESPTCAPKPRTVEWSRDKMPAGSRNQVPAHQAEPSAV